MLRNSDFDSKAVLKQKRNTVSKLEKKLHPKEDSLNNEKLALTGRIARTIAHEVRNPLTNIHLALEHLKTEIQGNDDYDLFFELINRNALRVNQLVSELLNAAKPLELNLKELSLDEIVAESIELISHHIVEKKIEIQKKKILDRSKIFADSEKLKLAVTNILINAVEASPEGSKLYIEINKKGEELVLQIKDTGSGIEKNDLPFVFDPFFTRKPYSRGLGLVAVQNIILSHNSRIVIDSHLNKGTTVCISFKTI